MMTNNEERQLGRAKNAVLSFLEQRLSIPKIYIDAIWDGHKIDVLAINRDGVGDVHAVLLLPTNLNRNPQTNEVDFNNLTAMDAIDLTVGVNELIAQFQKIPAQYKYIAAIDVSGRAGDPLFGYPYQSLDGAYAPDGIGRIGFLSIEFGTDGEAEAKIAFKPERFRAKIAKLADDYIQQHDADWEVRA